MPHWPSNDLLEKPHRSLGGVMTHQNTALSAWANATANQQLDKLVISQLGFQAQKRLARGVKLNHSEATVRSTPFLHNQ
jgi:hypothetical protein